VSSFETLCTSQRRSNGLIADNKVEFSRETKRNLALIKTCQQDVKN